MLRLQALYELKLTFRRYTDNYSFLKRVSFRCKLHVACDSRKTLDFAESIFDCNAVFLQIALQASILNCLQDNVSRIVCEGGNIIRDIAVKFLILFDEFLSFASRTLRSIVSCEVVSDYSSF